MKVASIGKEKKDRISRFLERYNIIQIAKEKRVKLSVDQQKRIDVTTAVGIFLKDRNDGEIT